MYAYNYKQHKYIKKGYLSQAER